jgi:hypothetical protein
LPTIFKSGFSAWLALKGRRFTAAGFNRLLLFAPGFSREYATNARVCFLVPTICVGTTIPTLLVLPHP